MYFMLSFVCTDPRRRWRWTGKIVDARIKLNRTTPPVVAASRVIYAIILHGTNVMLAITALRFDAD
jgi:hypothetical protein